MDKSLPAVTVVIPARFASSRFPGKPLALLHDKPIIQHVYERVAAAPGLGTVLVATDDRRILEAVRRFGGTAVLTEGPYRTGTDRVAAVAEQVPGEIFLNLQGDEILLDPALLSDLIDPFAAGGEPMGTLKRRLASADELRNPGAVKVVTDCEGRALYFSRAPIPHVRDRAAELPDAELHYLHLGIYSYRREALRRFAALPTGRLEEAEKLEQLRALEYGIPIRVWETRRPSLRIDTPDDLAEAAAVLAREPVTAALREGFLSGTSRSV